MTKKFAREMWRLWLGLVNRGMADEIIANPVSGFDMASIAGQYDALSPCRRKTQQHNYDQLGYGIWGSKRNAQAGKVLLTALEATQISRESMDQIVELLAECSAHTDYPDHPDYDETMGMDMDVGEGGAGREQTDRSVDASVLQSWTPKDIEAYLHAQGGVVGQADAVRAAATILYNHMRGRPSVSLFCAPTGSGKTHLWRVMQEMLASTPINVTIFDASTLSPEGAWKGGNKISSLLRAIPPERRGHAILVLDEFDKILEPQVGGDGTNMSDLVQNQLLKLFDHDPLFFGGDSLVQGGLQDTSGISVVLLGAFQRLLESKSRATSSIGFGTRHPGQRLDYSNTEITTEDLARFGMRQELVGRVTRVVCMDELSTRDMARIGQGEVERLARLTGRRVTVAGSTLNAMAQTAQKKGLGARWLKHSLEDALDRLIYEQPDAEEYRLEALPGGSDQALDQTAIP